MTDEEGMIKSGEMTDEEGMIKSGEMTDEEGMIKSGEMTDEGMIKSGEMTDEGMIKSGEMTDEEGRAVWPIWSVEMRWIQRKIKQRHRSVLRTSLAPDSLRWMAKDQNSAGWPERWMNTYPHSLATFSCFTKSLSFVNSRWCKTYHKKDPLIQKQTHTCT